MVYNQPGSRRPSRALALTGSPEVPDHRQDRHHYHHQADYRQDRHRHHCDDQDDSEYSDSRGGAS